MRREHAALLSLHACCALLPRLAHRHGRARDRGDGGGHVCAPLGTAGAKSSTIAQRALFRQAGRQAEQVEAGVVVACLLELEADRSFTGTECIQGLQAAQLHGGS